MNWNIVKIYGALWPLRFYQNFYKNVDGSNFNKIFYIRNTSGWPCHRNLDLTRFGKLDPLIALGTIVYNNEAA